MQALARLADAVGQKLLHIHMYILGVNQKFHLAGIYIVQNSAQALDNFLRVRLRDNPLPPEHIRVRDAAADILRVHPLVKAYRRVEIVHAPVCALLKTPAP